MAARWLSFAIFLHNLSGFLNHDFKKNKFSISKFKMCASITTLSFSLVVIYIFSTNKRLNEKVFRSATVQFKELSTFFRVSSVIAVSLLHLSGTIFNLCTRMIAGKIGKFFNGALSLEVSQESIKRFKTKCLWQSTIICILYCAVIFIKFLAITKFGFTYFLVFLIFIYPTSIALSIVTFVKGFEIFVAEVMEELKKAIEMNNKKQNFGQAILVRYNQIFKLVESFNYTFGNHLTALTCSITVLTVLFVSWTNLYSIFNYLFA